MSGTVTDPLTETEKVDARRFCGYPVYGLGPNDDTLNRFYPAFVTQEYRLANLTDPELVVCRAKLAELNTLDTAIPGAGANLDTDKAAVWTHNKAEVQDRERLFRLRRLALCEFLGSPPGPALARGPMRMVI